MKPALILLPLAAAAGLQAQGPQQLPPFAVHSPRIANQSPAGTYAMPVSALRFEPRVDVHARNLAEGQADVTLRGGIFENTGMQLGAVSLPDPQTAHYLAELPVAPALLGPPEIKVGTAQAAGAANSTVGTISQGWRRVRTGGAASAGMGQHQLRRAEIHQGYAGTGSRPAADVAFARSESEGAIPWGDHEFWRLNGRLQWAGDGRQTDVFAGYQEKFFGWPNLYTPFNSAESENLQTVLFVINHRREFPEGEFLEAGVFHRRNKDDYAFNRFAPLGAVHPFQHTTWLGGIAVAGRKGFGRVALDARAELLADELQSTSLVFGRFNSRTLLKLLLVPEVAWPQRDGGRLVARAGAAWDESNRDGDALAPVIEVAREFHGAGGLRVHGSYTKTTQVATYTALNSSATAGLFRGNPGLGRSASHDLELGLSGTFAGWTGSAAVFWRRDEALVDWTFQRGVTARTANPVDLAVGGFEAVGRRSWSRIDLVVGYTFLDKDADYLGAAVDASFYALNYARHRLTVAATLRLGRGFELRIDNVARVQADNLLRVIGGRRALATAAGLAYRPAQWPRLEFGLQADNLWDTDFQDVPAVPAAPRLVSFSVATTW